MEIQKLAVKEQIVKPVVRSGNGGAVWVPKSWLGEEVIVIRQEKPKLKIREKIVHLLEPYLKDIISVGIYGSYARNEQTKESDIDVLVITKDKPVILDLKKEKIDLVSFPINKFKTAIEKYPAIYYQMIQEVEPLVNESVFEELKRIKINKSRFKDYLKDTKEHLKSNKEFIELDKIDNIYLKSYSALYSSMLRLRTLFIIKCILNEDRFSNKRFKRWIMSRGFSKQEFEGCYNAYTAVRDDKDTKRLKIKISVAERVLNILDNELRLLEARIHGK